VLKAKYLKSDVKSYLTDQPEIDTVKHMVKYAASPLDIIFGVLSDPTRRAILERLSHGETSVTELAEPFVSDMSLPAISKHLRILEEAGFITRRREGRIHHLTLSAAPMQTAAEWLAYYRRFWEEQFDSLDMFLKVDPNEEAGQDDQSST
jgi:DNA-binding transcriptional ArsR family regulator